MGRNPLPTTGQRASGQSARVILAASPTREVVTAHSESERPMLGPRFSFANECLQMLQESFQAPVTNSRQAVLGEEPRQLYFILGFFAGRTGQGITTSTTSRLSLVKRLNSWLRQCMPDMTWSSIAVAHNVLAAAHADVANCPNSWNATLALGSFKGGGLSVADNQGAAWIDLPDHAVRASSLSFKNQMAIFRPMWPHATIPWEGDRWTVTCYTHAQVHSATPTVRKRLAAMGFPLPPCSQQPMSCVLESPPQQPSQRAAPGGRA